MPRRSATQPRVLVIGAGVIGLTVAKVLAESGATICIVAARRAPGITSAVAGAFWYPFHVDGYKHRWAEDSLRWFRSLYADAASGVIERVGREYFGDPPSAARAHDPHDELFWWKAIPETRFRSLPARDCPSRLDGHRLFGGIEFTVPVIDMRRYLRYLAAAVQQRGIPVSSRPVRSLASLAARARERFDVIVNCAGIGAADLLDGPRADTTLHAVAGQIVRMDPVPGCELTLVATGPFERAPVYMIPRLDDLTLGSTLDLHVRQRGDQRLPIPDPTISDRIVRRCAELAPGIASGRVRDVQVGLRPARSPVRVELDFAFPLPVVHAYGHGGAGVTLSYGTAIAVAELVSSVAPNST